MDRGEKMLVLRNFSKLFLIIGQIMAFFSVILLGLIFVNDGIVQFLPSGFIDTLRTIKEYAVMFTLIVVGFSVACRRGLILFVLYCLLAAAVVGFSFPALLG